MPPASRPGIPTATSTPPPDLVTGCTGGDLDYDGTSYWADWPDSVTPGMLPSPLTIAPPATVNGARYPRMQFLTNNPATSNRCNPQTLAGCVVPPPQAPGHFYPYWTQARMHGTCVWEFGQMRNGNTFGGTSSTVSPRWWWDSSKMRARSCPTLVADPLS